MSPHHIIKGKIIMMALRAVWRGIKDVWQKGYTYIWANLAFIAACLPIITIPAAWSALCRVCHEAQTAPTNADLDLFWEALKTNFWRAIPWGIAHAGIATIIILNLTENPASTTYTPITQIIWWGILFIWLGVFLATWAFYYEMESPTLIGATRNALIFVLQNPLFTLIILVVICIIGVISTVLVALWLVLSISAICAIETSGVLIVLEGYRKRLNEG